MKASSTQTLFDKTSTNNATHNLVGGWVWRATANAEAMQRHREQRTLREFTLNTQRIRRGHTENLEQGQTRGNGEATARQQRGNGEATARQRRGKSEATTRPNPGQARQTRGNSAAKHRTGEAKARQQRGNGEATARQQRSKARQTSGQAREAGGGGGVFAPEHSKLRLFARQ